MNILLITPGINKKYNDNYYAYDFMAHAGNNILAISQREHINKGKGTELSSKYEKNGRIDIYRIFQSLKQQKSFIFKLIHFNFIKKLLFDFQPDVIFCEELTNLALAIKIKKKYKIPIVLRVEFAYNDKYPYRTMGHFLKFFKNKITGNYFPILIGKIIWNWANKNSDSIISCYFEDTLNNNKYTKFKTIRYVPWPTYLPNIITKSKVNSNRMIFVGSFDKHKNLQELELTIPLILENTPIDEFYIIGTGEDLNIINNLKLRYPNNIKHFISLSRDECLNLINCSFLSYSPATRGGWGFIGDSFATKTPILITHNHYGFNDYIDSIVTSPSQIVNRVNELYSNRELYNKISMGGYDRFINIHSSEGVGKKYIRICEDAIKSNSF